uniref:Uncharacterized protein n=1 Tax=Rhizophora mucronata TaxID=61149 RepID=A0A2P2QSB6_RHIMU
MLKKCSLLLWKRIFWLCVYLVDMKICIMDMALSFFVLNRG